jgi:hypothetical protein
VNACEMAWLFGSIGLMSGTDSCETRLLDLDGVALPSGYACFAGRSLCLMFGFIGIILSLY